MRFGASAVKTPHIIGTLLATLALGGCGGGSAINPGEGIGAKISSLAAFGSTTPPPAPAAADPTALRLVCPDVEVLDGTASMRFYAGGAGSGNVRYQYSMGEVARECGVAGNQVSLKVGVEGRVLLGPAGSPGSFSVPVRISVRREKDGQIAATKTYRVAANVASGDTQGIFQVVSEPLLVPLTREDTSQDYTIVVGFDGTGGGTLERTPAKPKRR